MRELALELLEFVDDVVDDLGSRERGRVRAHGLAAKAPAPSASSRSYRADRRPQGRRAAHRRARPSSGAQSEATQAMNGSAVASGPMKVGLLCGREYSFPPAFIERVNQLGAPHGITAEMVKLGGTQDGRAGRIPRHRRSHLARGRILPRLSEARRAAGHVRHQQSVLVDGRRQVFQLLGDGEARRRHSEDGAAAAEGLSGGRRHHSGIAAQPEVSRSIGTRCSITSAARRS